MQLYTDLILLRSLVESGTQDSAEQAVLNILTLLHDNLDEDLPRESVLDAVAAAYSVLWSFND